MKNKKKVRIAVVQATPVVFNKDATIDKAVALTMEASSFKPDIILFPESFIPAYPRNLSFGTYVGHRSDAGRELWEKYYSNSVTVPGEETDKLAAAAKESGSYISMGITERDGKSLFCTQLFFSPKGELLGKHRKIKPTAAERIIWGEGDGSTLTTFSIPGGIVGTLICWENYMPLARMSMYNKGVNIYLAPTADCRESWQNTLKHIALEGRCFVIGCNQYVSLEDYPDEILDLDGIKDRHGVISTGGSAIISPFGEYLAGPVSNREEILFAELDMEMVTRASFDFDAAGHYNRPDIFNLSVRDQPEPLES